MPFRRENSPFWYISWIDPATKKQKFRSSGTTSKRQAIGIEASQRAEAADEAEHGKRWTVAETMTEGLQEHYYKATAASTQARAYHAVMSFEDDPLWSMYVDSIEPHHINQRTKRRRDAGIGNATIRKEFQVFSRSIRCVNDLYGAGLSNPVTGNLPPKPKTEVVAPTLDQFQLIHTAAGDSKVRSRRWVPDMMLFWINTGLRPGELCALRCDQIDLTRGRIIFGVMDHKGRRQDWIPLNKEARTIAVKWLRMNHGQETLFCKVWTDKDKVNKYSPIQSIRKAVEGACKRAGVPHFSPHKYRHAFASYILARGYDIRTLQLLLRHSEIRTTEIYSHLSESRLVDAVEDISGISEQGDSPSNDLPRIVKATAND